MHTYCDVAGGHDPSSDLQVTHMKYLRLLILLCPALLGAQIVVTVSNITETQAELSYVAPSSSTCTLQVSESPTLSPLVHDVDSSLFSGANVDNRVGNLSTGLWRGFILGTRRSDQAADGNLYSRALQANTTHYYHLVCGSSTASGQFTTVNPVLGNTFPEPPPYNSAGPGNYGWPTIFYNDAKATTYIDPQTGFLLKRLTGPGESAYSYVHGYNAGNPASAFDSLGGFAYVRDINSAWTNPANITAGAQGTVTTYTANAGDPIFVAWDNTTLVPSNNGTGFSTYNPGSTGFGTTLDNIQLAFFGSDTAGSTIEACLSFYDSGGTCSTAWQTLTMPSSAATSPAASAVYPASTVATSFSGGGGTAHTYTPYPDGGPWQGWGITVPRNAIAIFSGTVSVSGSTVTNTTYLGEFNLNWKSGARIFITGSSPTCPSNICTITSVTNANTLVISQSLTLTNVAYHSLASGVIIKKPTPSTGTLMLSVSSSYAESMQVVNPNGGDNQICSFQAATVSYAADGVTPITPTPGYICTFPVTGNGNPMLHLLIPSTGESRFLTPNYVDNYANQSNSLDQVRGTILQWQVSMFDASTPTKLYVPSGANVGGLFTVTYTGSTYAAYKHSLYVPASNSFSPGVDTTFGSGYHEPMWSDSAMNYTAAPFLISTSNTLQQIEATSPAYNSTLMTSFNIAAVKNGHIFIADGHQDQAAGLFVVNGTTGALEFGGWSLNSAFPLRWNLPHSTTIGAPMNNFITTGHLAWGQGNGADGDIGFQDIGLGPYVFTPTTMDYGSGSSSNTSIPASAQPAQATGQNNACPGGLATFLTQQGATGNNCITFQSQMACGIGPYWPTSGTTTLNGAISSGATSLTVASATGISVGTYLYIQNPTQAPWPGYELVYVSGVSGLSLTVTRSVNTVVQAQSNGATVYVLTGSQSPEAAAFPCDHGPVDHAGHPVWSEPSPIQVGDIFSLLPLVAFWPEYETWQIVSVTSLGSANYQFVASRFPTSDINSTCFAPSYTPAAWPNGWSGYMRPPCGATELFDTNNIGAGWNWIWIGGGHTAFGFGGPSSYDTVVTSSDAFDAHTVTYQAPLVSPSNPWLPNYSWFVNSNVTWNGYAPTYPWQSYPSGMDFSAPDPLMGRQVLDFQANNAAIAGSADTGEATGGSCGTGTLVGGTSTVWAFTCSVPYKYIQPVGYYGYHLAQDISGPGSVISDSTPGAVCHAYAANECVLGSSPGTSYIAAPQVGGNRTNGSTGTCWNNFWDENQPCITQMQWHGASAVQGRVDAANPNGQNFRKITMAMGGPGIQFDYSGITLDPTGQWGMFDCNWCNLYRSDIFAAKLPPFPAGQSVTNVGTSFIPLTINLPPSSTYDQARVRFGYAESSGNPANLYCTARADGCVTSTSIAPFAFLSESNGYQSCSAGCTITVPGLPGRFLYYVVDRQNSGSSAVSSSPMQAVSNP